MLLSFFSQKICFEQIYTTFFSILMLSLAALDITVLGRNQQSSLNECSSVYILHFKHHYLFLFVPILLEYLLLDFQVFLIRRLCGVKISTSVEGNRPNILLIDRFWLFLGHRFAGFGDGWFNSDHFPNKIKVYCN